MKKINYYTLIAIAAAILLIQYEIREFYRYEPTLFWRLKFYLLYGFAVTSLWIACLGAYFRWRKNKTPEDILAIPISIIALITVWAIQNQTQDIHSNNIVLKYGLYINSETGNILDGCYKQKSAWDNFDKGETCIKQNFEQGHPCGQWMESHKGYLIHKGKYLKLPETQNSIKQLTKSLSVAMNWWQEGDFKTMNIDLIEPKQADTITLNSVVKLVEHSCNERYPHRSISIRKLSGDKTEVLFSHDLVSNKQINDGIPQGY